MTTKTKPEQEQENKGLFELSRKVLLAGVGAAVLAQEEAEKFVGKLQEKGEVAEKDARRLLDEMNDKRKKIERERKAEAVRSQPAVATKEEVEDLHEKVDKLTEVIQQLKNELAAQDKPAK